MKNSFTNKVENACRKHKIKFTEQRRVIAKVIEESMDHPDVEKLFLRAIEIDSEINLTTIYRNINLFEKFGLLKKHYFGDQKARYELDTDVHHDHIIDIDSGEVTEFSTTEINRVLLNILDMMGYDMVNYNLEVYAIKKNSDK